MLRVSEGNRQENERGGRRQPTNVSSGDNNNRTNQAPRLAGATTQDALHCEQQRSKPSAKTTDVRCAAEETLRGSRNPGLPSRFLYSSSSSAAGRTTAVFAAQPPGQCSSSSCLYACLTCCFRAPECEVW